MLGTPGIGGWSGKEVMYFDKFGILVCCFSPQGDNTTASSPITVVKLHFQVVWGEIIKNFVSVDHDVSLPSSLETH